MPMWWDGDENEGMKICPNCGRFCELVMTPIMVLLTTRSEVGVATPPWQHWMATECPEVNF